MQREFSAGGVLVRRLRGQWMMAAIRPMGKPEGTWALPKGRIDDGEQGEATALREVEEETGARGRSLGKLGDVRYWFNWRGERIFKVVSFFLVRYEGGKLGDITDAFRHEVAEARLRSHRKTATIRLGDKSRKYQKGMIVSVLVGARFGPRQHVFDAVIDKVEVKRLGDLSPREIEHDNPEIRRTEEMAHFLGQLYNREVTDDDTVTVIRFSQIRS